MTKRLAGRLSLRPSAGIGPSTIARIRVFVDGDRLTGVVAFDTWQGWVDVLRRDDRGRFVMLAGAAQRERRHGRVIAVAERATVREVEQLVDAGLVAS